MSQATMSAGSASAWSGKSLVDAAYGQRRGRIVLNNNLGAQHSVAGFSSDQVVGDVVDVINRGSSPIILAAEDSAAPAKDRFASGIHIPARGHIRLFYNGSRWEPFSEGAGLVTKVLSFTENAVNTSHVATLALPPGSILRNIEVLNPVLWGAGAAVLKVGDTADDDGYFINVNLKATDLLVGEVLMTDPSTSWGGKEGAYLVAASGRRGPVTTNFGKYYGAGSNIIATVTVTTPGSANGRTFVVVTYLPTGGAVPAVVSGP